jgi:hypothetical protein
MQRVLPRPPAQPSHWPPAQAMGAEAEPLPPSRTESALPTALAPPPPSPCRRDMSHSC